MKNIAVVKLANAHIVGRRKVVQHRPAEVRQHIMRKLWERGEPGDLRAVDPMVHADRSQTPDFLKAPRELRVVVAPGAPEAAQAAALLDGSYWNAGIPRETLVAAQLGWSAWLVAVDERDRRRVVATARAVSDGAKFAYVVDVLVHPDWRGAGVASALMRLLLDHPAVRGCRRVELHTRDAMPVYAALGFGPMVDPAWRVGMRLVR